MRKLKIKRSELEYLSSLVFNDIQEKLEDLKYELGIPDNIEIDSFNSFIEQSEQITKDLNDEDTENVLSLIDDISELGDLYARLNKKSPSHKLG